MLNVAVIGIGNIGLLYDQDFDDKSKVLSHIKAINLHQHFTLKYIVDIDITHLKTVKSIFPKVVFYNNYKKLLDKEDIDILVIATPTHTHFTILNAFQLNKRIKLFFIEKPLFNKKVEYQRIHDSVKSKLVINYLRRYDYNIQKLRLDIKNCKYGDLQKIVINYCKGLKNNGSHMIDMINFLFDNPTIISTKILSHTEGFDESDLTYDIFIEIKNRNNIIPVYFIGLNHTLYNIIEQNLFFENKIIKYINSKSTIEYYDIVSDKNFSEYKVSSDIPKVKEVQTTTLMLNAYDNLVEIIDNNIKNISSYEDELANIDFLYKILEGEK